MSEEVSNIVMQSAIAMAEAYGLDGDRLRRLVPNAAELDQDHLRTDWDVLVAVMDDIASQAGSIEALYDVGRKLHVVNPRSMTHLLLLMPTAGGYQWVLENVMLPRYIPHMEYVVEPIGRRKSHHILRTPEPYAESVPFCYFSAGVMSVQPVLWQREHKVSNLQVKSREVSLDIAYNFPPAWTRYRLAFFGRRQARQKAITEMALFQKEVTRKNRELDRAHDDLYRILSSVPDILVVLEGETMLYANLTARRQLGSGDLHAPVQECFAEETRRRLQEIIRKRELKGVAVEFARENAKPAILRVSEIVGIQYGDRDADLLVCQDLTEQRELEGMIVSASELEQQRIGRDLHDGLGPLLTTIALRAQALCKKMGEEDPQAADAREIARLAQLAQRHGLELARDLGRNPTEQRDVRETLQRIANRTTELFCISCEVHWTGEPAWASAEFAMDLGRFFQEAVRNAYRHGGAQSIHARVTETAFLVDDDGNGKAEDLKFGSGMGLHNLQHRAREMGGVFFFEELPEAGMRVGIRFSP